MSKDSAQDHGILGRIISLFLRGNLAPLVILVSVVAGATAIVLTPREEEPQIVVPMADIMVSAPGLPVADVERQVSTPLEKLLFQIDGVEHVYSISYTGRAVVTVRFYVGEDREDSLVKIYNKLYSNTDSIPADVTSWVVKPIEIDDVPIVIATLWSERPEEIDDHALHRLAQELEIELQSVPDTNRAQVVGGRPRIIRVELDPDALSARRTSPLDVALALQVSNVRRQSGSFDRADTNFTVEAGDLFADAGELRRAVVNVVDGTPVFLEDVARVVDGPEERQAYSWIGFGPAEQDGSGAGRETFYPAVHIAIAKQRGTNAVRVSERVQERLTELAKTHLPEGVHYRITRDYGATANDKVNELLEALAVAILIVVGLIAYTLGWREGLVVAAAVPITFALTLLINYWAGYTINRVTLFALILSLGLVVDDPIVDVENIHRHLVTKRENAFDAVLRAVNEVRPPILLATLAVIVSFLPMVLITGMMGPYMRPMALNVPVAMAMSMVVAFVITPWLAYHVLKDSVGKSDAPKGEEIPQGLYRLYSRALAPFVENRGKAWALLGVTFVLFCIAVTLAATRSVPLKMLPFDNKNELQIVVDPAEGTTLERTDAIARRLARIVQTAPEVTDLEIFTGTASPMDFNGMVRHYFLRSGTNVADIRIQFTGKRGREMQSHEIALRLRPALQAAAVEEGARIKVVEVPPGPPVLATITAEVYGAPGTPYGTIRKAARAVERRLTAEPGVSDVDSSVEDDATRIVFEADQEKAALSGIATDDITRTVTLALSGQDVARLHVPGEVHPLQIRLRMPRDERSGLAPLHGLAVKGRQGIAKIKERGSLRDAPTPIVRLGELGRFEPMPREKAIYHKDLVPVAFVYAEAVGRAPAAIVTDVAADLGATAQNADATARPVSQRSFFSNGGGIAWSLPPGTQVNWLGEGELNITVDVFRDLGIAFAVALVGIYFLLVYQTASYAMPLILMISIPLTMIGIMPGFWLLNLIGGGNIGGYANPTFFTATAMIGMIALSGIAVRNAILLIEFVHIALARGASLHDSLLRAGAVRTRAILLTAGTAMLAAAPITLDPVFSGLAWALIFGLVVSTGFTLLVVPVTYYLVYANKPGHGLPAAPEQGMG
jgi:multidrug efflux pump subunit AcrB